ncbi:MAG TPA: serine hydrolase domain-containing protein [Steroidobacter sp.]
MVARRSVLQGLLGTLCMSEAARAMEPTAIGAWSGILQAGSQRLRLKFDIGPEKGSLFSIDQGAGPIPLEVVSLTPQAIELKVPAIRASYRGKQTGPDRIEGEWDQGMAMPLVLLRGDAGLQAPLAETKPLDLAALKELRQRAGAPALGAMVSWAGEAPQIWVDGERAVGSRVATSLEDRWHIGSITKSMTATLVARLVEAKAVRWDDTVGDVLGDKISKLQPAYAHATFKHLLSHRAGFPKDIPMNEFETFEHAVDGPTRHERLRYASIALNQNPIGEIAKRFEYANNGYIVAATMLEQKLEQDWETLLMQHVFEPLGIRSAGFGAPGSKGQLDQPAGHLPTDRPVAQLVGKDVTDNPVAVGPAGRVHLSLGDLARYLAAHRDETDFLSKDSWKTLHTPPFGGAYAMGWHVRPDQTLWHNGSNTLWYAEVLIDKRKGQAAAAVSNIANGKAAMAAGDALLRAAANRT